MHSVTVEPLESKGLLHYNRRKARICQSFEIIFVAGNYSCRRSVLSDSGVVPHFTSTRTRSALVSTNQTNSNCKQPVSVFVPKKAIAIMFTASFTVLSHQQSTTKDGGRHQISLLNLLVVRSLRWRRLVSRSELAYCDCIVTPNQSRVIT
jgi:hypothetical protein